MGRKRQDEMMERGGLALALAARSLAMTADGLELWISPELKRAGAG